MTRQVLTADSFEAIVQQTVYLAHKAGATDFQLAHDPIDRVLGPNEQVDPDEPVRWTVTASLRSRLGTDQRVGSAISAKGAETNMRAIAYACARLVELLGANLVMVDPSDEEAPAW